MCWFEENPSRGDGVGYVGAQLRLEPPGQRPLPFLGLRIAFADAVEERMGHGAYGVCVACPHRTSTAKACWESIP